MFVCRSRICRKSSILRTSQGKYEHKIVCRELNLVRRIAITVIRSRADCICASGYSAKHQFLRLVFCSIIPLVAFFLCGHGFVPPVAFALLVGFQVNNQIRVFLASEDGWSHGAAGELLIHGGVPLGGEGSVALDEAVGEYGVAVDVGDGGRAALRLEGGEVGVVDDVVEAVGLVGLVDALDGVCYVHGVCPGVLLLDVGYFDAWSGEEAAGEKRREPQRR